MPSPKDFNHSYWELKHYFKLYDLIIVGSGIVGLSTALSYKKRNKKAKILILERGVLPNGASTKNAGFACFGSPGELLDDLAKMPEKKVWETVKMRWEGLQILRKRLQDKNMDYKPYGGFELFDSQEDLDLCLQKLPYLNACIKKELKLTACYTDVSKKNNPFNRIKGILFNAFEGQIDTGLMMHNLLRLIHKNDIEVLNNIQVLDLNDLQTSVELQTNQGVFKASKVVVATNGFAASLLNVDNVKPARAQVLITKPISDLKIKGTFHFKQGYYYFRNIDNRILFGGGRNLDFKVETTTQQGLNEKIQNQLEVLLREMILPKTPFEIDLRWSGIMGVGSEKKPIIKKVSQNTLAAIRMGGMGVAIGSWVGEKAALEIL